VGKSVNKHRGIQTVDVKTQKYMRITLLVFDFCGVAYERNSDAKQVSLDTMAVASQAPLHQQPEK
jgi:hypothetical protein